VVAVLNWIWQGSVVACITTLVLALIERSSARDRYLTVWAALFSVLALPIVPYLRDAIADVTVTGGDAAARAPFVSMPAAWWTSDAAVLVLWALWLAVSGYRLASAAVSLRRVKRASVRVPAARQACLRHWASVTGDGRRTDLRVSMGVHAAAVLGCGAPMIAIAPGLLDWLTDDELDGIVIHEWAHVQRRDDLMHLAQSCIGVIAGWHPAVWWLGRQLRLEREIACDELAVAKVGSAKRYAASLVKLAGLPLRRVPLLPAVTAIAPSGLRRRVTRILSADRRSSLRTWRVAAAAAGASLWILAGALGGVRAIAAASDVTNVIEAVAERIVPVATIESVLEPSPQSAPVPVRAMSPGAGGSRPATRSRGQTSPANPDSQMAATSVRETTASHEAEIGASRVSTAFNARAPATISPSSAAANKPSIAPWRATADGGVSLGRESREAAVATAGYFTKLGKRIAGSF
jgi:beta-lactamase regulating signal transducer with metallopeptidase domain